MIDQHSSRSLAVVVAGCLWLAPGALQAAGGSPTADRPASDDPCVVVVVGAPGTSEYGEAFDAWARNWEEAAAQGRARYIRIGPRVSGAEAAEPSKEESDRDDLRALLEGEARLETEAALWIVLLGHGTFDGKLAKFNLRGPDVSAAELAKWLKGASRPLAVINCASSSGPFINRLSAPNRVVVTATRSGYELNYARFGEYLAEEIASQSTDIDKDDQVSLLEAFLAASARTAEFYEKEARLATEHALIDDNGDGLGTPAEWFRGIRAVRRARDGAAPDGANANRFLLVRSEIDLRMPADLRERRDELEVALETLRLEKDALDAEVYFSRLEPIIVELARIYEQVEQRERQETTAEARDRPPARKPLAEIGSP